MATAPLSLINLRKDMRGATALSPVEQTALDFIRARAAAGETVTRADIAIAIGSQNLWGGTAPGVLNRLEAKGYITRTFYQRGLQVCDVKTGKCTAPPQSRATHWRHREEKVATMAGDEIKRRNHPVGVLIEMEARREGKSLQDFQMQLLINGLELWLEKRENDDAA
jgi:hypothetical protein